jgi:hypothetical protein
VLKDKFDNKVMPSVSDDEDSENGSDCDYEEECKLDSEEIESNMLDIPDDRGKDKHVKMLLNSRNNNESKAFKNELVGYCFKEEELRESESVPTSFTEDIATKHKEEDADILHEKAKAANINTQKGMRLILQSALAAVESGSTTEAINRLNLLRRPENKIESEDEKRAIQEKVDKPDLRSLMLQRLMSSSSRVKVEPSQNFDSIMPSETLYYRGNVSSFQNTIIPESPNRLTNVSNEFQQEKGVVSANNDTRSIDSSQSLRGRIDYRELIIKSMQSMKKLKRFNASISSSSSSSSDEIDEEDYYNRDNNNDNDKEIVENN